MNEPIPEDELETLFGRQRAVHRDNAPSFHATRTRGLDPEATVHSLAPFLWRWALPGAAMLALVMVALLATRHPKAPPAREALAHQLNEIDAALQRSLAAQHELTAWQSPTDFLLQPIHHDPRP
jgi:hypothetical protein